MLIGIEQAQLHRFFSRFGFRLCQPWQSGFPKSFWLAFDIILFRKRPFDADQPERGATLSTIAAAFNLHPKRRTK